ncbi:MAG: hypothetical protein Pg6B_04570 [Candidatus Azobacteroides pseudotrichonymphae]|uniref:Uncharacterized protein n=1 Tax=Candidatus Improbicoccus pseudotrichonymphae TaxID=3033792 RepID=A0AA48IGQ6_9FIRM|nr:MAG: hypothetical protein CfP315_0187 [Candidatus Improbicoccus pseudotrichonymphae]GMO34157.1 MAG: hypothetical protein Pg6B_04570 [Candidatus Azobacteroides pseudotrichonymphae]
MTVDELLNNLEENAPQDKPLFYKLYKASIEVLTKSGSGEVDGRKITPEEAEKVLNYYVKIFKAEYGPILMDKGVQGTDQGINMEYAVTNKPITYVGLDSCIGLTIPQTAGTHLVIPFDGDQKKTYLERVEMIIGYYDGKQEIVICAVSKDSIGDHIYSVLSSFGENPPEPIKWLSGIIDREEYIFLFSEPSTVTC